MKERVTEYTCCPKCGLPFITETDTQITKRLIEEACAGIFNDRHFQWSKDNIYACEVLNWLDGRDDD